jgi:hypothetical protein
MRLQEKHKHIEKGQINVFMGMTANQQTHMMPNDCADRNFPSIPRSPPSPTALGLATPHTDLELVTPFHGVNKTRSNLTSTVFEYGPALLALWPSS